MNTKRRNHCENDHAKVKEHDYGLAPSVSPKSPQPREQRAGIAFETIDVTDDVQARAELVERAGGRRTVPVIFVDGQAIGGYQELAAMVRAGQLKHISAAA